MDYMITTTKEGFELNLSVCVQFQWKLVSHPEQISKMIPKTKMDRTEIEYNKKERKYLLGSIFVGI